MKSNASRRFKTCYFIFAAVMAETVCLPLMAAEQGNQYQAVVQSANIAPTAATAKNKIKVFGEPQTVKGHPCLLWDNTDIAHYKEMLKTSKELQIQLADMKERLEARMAEPWVLPEPQKGADGNWLYPGDYFPDVSSFGYPNATPQQKFTVRVSRDVEAISDLGILYALTGDAKYAEYAKKLLLGHAHFPQYGAPKTYDPRFAQGTMTQHLDEALMLEKAANGYDLIYNLPSWTPKEREQLHDGLFRPLASQFLYPQAPEKDPSACFASQNNNRGAIGSTSVLMTGYATDDQELINAALYGISTTLKASDPAHRKQFPPPQDWIASTKEKPTGGLLATHFGPPCISGGMWVEGTISYTFYALGNMVLAAEVAWHHGIDLYRHNDGLFKCMFDFPILLGYPDRTTPGLNDGARFSMLQGNSPIVYEYGYRRYRDPQYLAYINNPEELKYLEAVKDGKKPEDPKIRSARSLSIAHIGSTPMAVLYDLNPAEGKGVPLQQQSANYPSVGYGVLRTPEANGTGIINLTMSYGPSASHGHPDKLQIDLFAFNDVLMPSPGVQYPYVNNPQLENWYHETVAHNTLTVDEKVQVYAGNLFKYPKDTPTPQTEQLVYGPASTMGIQRAWTDKVNPGVTMDRAVFLTQNYLADLFGAFSATPHKYDLAWHIRGEVASELKFEPITFPEPVAKGYNFLTNVRQAASDKPWSVTLNRDQHTARLLAAASGTNTKIIAADSGIYVDITSSDRHKRPTAPTILERRENLQSTLYGNAVDLSDSKGGYIKSVTQEGGVIPGYGLLKVETLKGTDICFAAYRPGNYKVGELETDAQQALVLMDGKNVLAMYLGGGKALKTTGGALARSEPGLAYVEKTSSGSYILANPSPTEATITVTLPALQQLSTFNLDDKGQRIGAASIKSSSPSTFMIQLKAASKVEFAQK